MKKPQVNNNNIPNNANSRSSLVSIDYFQEPSRKNRRSFQPTEQYRNRAPIIINKYENDKYRNSSRSNKFTGIVLSDTMYKYARAGKVHKVFK